MNQPQHLALVQQRYRELAAQAPLLAIHAEAVFEKGELLGRGGLAEVYRVHDTRLGRDAALKVLRSGKINEGNIDRFLRELKLTARLDHPCIPPVYEAGLTPSGEYFLLMRVIEGQTLRDLVKEHHAARPSLATLRPLLQALVKVGEAVAYAHSRGILHRDLKPANIMIGEFGEVMVMDWGLAKDLRDANQNEGPRPTSPEFEELAEAGLTQTGVMLGTLGYMPPEQALGSPVDESADVFALGAILTTVLTGLAPLHSDRTEVRYYMTIEGQITTPRQRNRRVPRDLDALAAAALNPDSTQRLSSAREFTEELKRFLDGQALQLYSYRPTERLTRAARRHPSVLALLVTGLMLAVTLTAAVIWRLQEARERSFDSEQAHETERLTRYAQAQQRQARQAVAALTNAQMLARRGADPKLIAEAMDKGLGPNVESLSLFLTGAQIYRNAGNYSAARKLLFKAVKRYPPAYEALFELHQLSLRENPDRLESEHYNKLMRLARENGDENKFTLYFSGSKAYNQGRFDEARVLFDRVLARRPFPPALTGRGVLRGRSGDHAGAMDDFNKAIALRPDYIEAYLNRAALFRKTDRPRRAIDDLSKALELHPTNPLALFQRGRCYILIGLFDEALKDLNRASQLNPRLDEIYLSRGLVHGRLGKLQASLEDFRRYLDRHPRDVEARLNVGVTLERLNRLSEALATYTRAIATDDQSAGAYAARAILYFRTRRYDKALTDLNKALQLDPQHFKARYSRAVIYCARNRYQDALKDYQVLAAQTPQNADLHLNKGAIHDMLGQLDEALKEFNLVLRLQPGSPDALVNRGRLFIRMKRFPQALKDLDRACKLRPSAEAYHNLGTAQLSTGQERAALRSFTRALRLNPQYPKAAWIRNQIERLNRRLTGRGGNKP